MPDTTIRSLLFRAELGPDAAVVPPGPGPAAYPSSATRAIAEMLSELTYHHLSSLVTDLDISRELYSISLGIDSWSTRVQSGPVLWRGRPIHIEGVRTARGRLGSSLIELVEPGRLPWLGQRILDRRGEGIFSVGYEVDDVAGSVRRALAAGCLVEQLRGDLCCPRSVHLDAGSGLLLELIPAGAEWEC